MPSIGLVILVIALQIMHILRKPELFCLIYQWPSSKFKPLMC